jgi:hypothetical protein
MMNGAFIVAEYVAVIVVPDAKPDGACAEAIQAWLERLPPLGCLSTVHVKPPPETPVTVPVLSANQPPLMTMNLPEATVCVVTRPCDEAVLL